MIELFTNENEAFFQGHLEFTAFVIISIDFKEN